MPVERGTLPEKCSGQEGTLSRQLGLDEEMVRAYIRNQEQEDERYDQMKLDV
jgi:hypothetical protein